MELEEKNDLIKIAGYGRVSTDSKDQKNSLEHQKACYEREYKNNPKYLYDDKYLYFDRGITGTSLTRPEFDRMLYDAGLDIIEVHNNDNDNRRKYLDYVTIPSSSRKPCFNLIIVRNTSRFARNINVVKILEQLKQIGVFVYFCDIDKTTANTTDMEEIQSHLLSAERESRMKSRMVIFGTREGALSGVIRASKRLYGYKYIGSEIKTEIRLEIIEEEAEVIRKIFKWYLEGYGIRRISRLLSKNEIYTRSGNEFGVNTIRGILTNEKYKGWSVRNKYDMGTVFNKKTYAHVRNKEEWIIDKNTDKIPAIIDEKDFDKVQEMLYSKKEHVLNKGRYFGISEFASKIICGKCGSVYYSNKDKSRQFYNCSRKRRFGLDKCNNKNVSLKQINDRISPENYRKDMYESNIYYVQKLAILAYKLICNFNSKDAEMVKNLEQETEVLKQRKNRIVDMFEMGYVDKNEFVTRATAIDEQIKEKTIKMTQLNKTNQEILNDLNDIHTTTSKLKYELEILTMLKDKEFEKEYTREYIMKDIEKILVKEDGTMVVFYHTFDKYYKLTEKYKDLLNVYVKDDTISEFKKNSNINMYDVIDKINNELERASI